jgi:hypothetical protein
MKQNRIRAFNTIGTAWTMPVGAGTQPNFSRHVNAKKGQKEPNLKQSGRWLFFLYAWPCIEVRLQKKLMTQEEAGVLYTLMDNKEVPNHRLLERSFPDAFKAFEAFLKKAQIGKVANVEVADLNSPWPIEVVRKFWRSHLGDSPVMCGVVTEFNHVSLKVLWGTEEIVIVNTYKLHPKPGDTVFFHQHVLIEVERPSSKQAKKKTRVATASGLR